VCAHCNSNKPTVSISPEQTASGAWQNGCSQDQAQGQALVQRDNFVKAAYRWRQAKQDAERQLHVQASTVRRGVWYHTSSPRSATASSSSHALCVRLAVHEKGVQGAQNALNLHVSLHLG
jgi:hypothetical protein